MLFLTCLLFFFLLRTLLTVLETLLVLLKSLLISIFYFYSLNNRISRINILIKYIDVTIGKSKVKVPSNMIYFSENILDIIKNFLYF
jgi:hypothetical protein